VVGALSSRLSFQSPQVGFAARRRLLATLARNLRLPNDTASIRPSNALYIRVIGGRRITFGGGAI
jgi:hypothetical protein